MAKVKTAKDRITAYLKGKGLDVSEIKDAFDELEAADVDLEKLSAATGMNTKWEEFWNKTAVPEFQKVQAEESAMLYDGALVSTILPMVPGLVERLKDGITVADAGCGQGHAINVMAKAFPTSTFTGYDFSKEGVAAGKAEAKKWRLQNARFEAKDIAHLDLRGTFDFVTALDTIHDQAKPMQVLRQIRAALRPGGDFLMMDIAGSSRLEENLQHPLGPVLYSVSVLHCMTVSLAYDGEGLGTVWGEQKAQEYLTKAGFRDITVKHLDGDPFHVFFIAKR